MTKAQHTPGSIAVGQYIKLISMGDDQWNQWYVHRYDSNGNFYAKQCREFACGEELVTQGDVM